MSLLKRFIRYFQTNRTSELELRDLVGIAGEQYASQFLDPAAVAAYVANPVLPHPNNAQKYLETDLLVYAAGTLNPDPDTAMTGLLVDSMTLTLSFNRAPPLIRRAARMANMGVGQS